MSQKPVYQNMAMSPEQVFRVLSQPRRPASYLPQQAGFLPTQVAQQPAIPSQADIYGQPAALSANDEFFSGAASPESIQDMDVNKYRQLIYELRKKGYFQGPEGQALLEDRNALLNPEMQATVNLAAEIDPFVSTIRDGTKLVENKFPNQLEEYRQKQALEKWKLQKYHDAKVREMMGNKLMVGY